MSIALVSSSFLEEQAARIRARSLSWENYPEGPQYALLLTSILKKLARTEPTQAVLVMIGDALAGLLATNTGTQPPEHILTPLLHKLSINTLSSSPNAQDVSLQCLAALLSLRSARSLAWRNQGREVVKGLVKILKGPPVPAPQIAYLAGYAVWLLSFDQEVVEGINSEFDVIPVLVGIAQGAGKEKVIRVIIATFKNLASKAPSANLPSMLVAKLLGKTFLDRTYDEYTSELASGVDRTRGHVLRLRKTFLLRRANLEKEFAQLKRLVELLKTSEDKTVLAVAAHDLGQYVKHHDRGKKVHLLEPPFRAHYLEYRVSLPDVRYRALISVQRLVSTPWVVA
ncbi:unnamed protein product [Rhizoctonia solani]|uniref:ATPase V1 complex subunit H C-terminal domain-containing protein n=1 Tax=Rhizoctonia solani TaxID=456999 RepID=A0A8H3B3D9_9AGAM|nr:unnamed protein product [Rhizoctonia solani]